MSSAFSSTSVIDNDAAPAPETKLTLIRGCTAESDADSSTVFSSLKQTAVALTTAASSQASQRAREAARTAPGVREAVADAERLENSVQRANADQARRVAACTRAAFDSLVRHTLQPCLALDEIGRIVRWNSAMAAWTGITSEDALSQPLTAIFEAGTAAEIEEANVALREAEAEPGDPDEDPVFTLDGVFTLARGGAASCIALLPLCRLPRLVEEVIVLLTPAP